MVECSIFNLNNQCNAQCPRNLDHLTFNWGGRKIVIITLDRTLRGHSKVQVEQRLSETKLFHCWSVKLIFQNDQNEWIHDGWCHCLISMWIKFLLYIRIAGLAFISLRFFSCFGNHVMLLNVIATWYYGGASAFSSYQGYPIKL